MKSSCTCTPGYKAAKRLLLALALIITAFAAKAAAPDNLYVCPVINSNNTIGQELTKNGEKFSGSFSIPSNTHDWGTSIKLCVVENGSIKTVYGFSGIQYNDPIVSGQSYGVSTDGQSLLLPPKDVSTYNVVVDFSQDPPTAIFTKFVPTTTYYTLDGGSTYNEASENLMFDANNTTDFLFGYKVKGISETKYGPASNTTYSSGNNNYTFTQSENYLTLPKGDYTYIVSTADLTEPTAVTVVQSAKIIYPKTKYITVNTTKTEYADGDYLFSAGDVISFSGKLSDNSGEPTWGLASDTPLAADTYTLTKGKSGKFTAPSDADDYVYTLTLNPGEGEQTTWTLTVTTKKNTSNLSKTLPRGFNNPGNYKPQNPLTIWYTSEKTNDAFADANSTGARTFLLGNGRIGISTTASRSEKILLNDKTQYDGILDSNHTLESTDNNTYNALGYVYSEYTGVTAGSTLSQLDLINGVVSAISTHGSVQIAREYLVSRKYDVAVVHYTSSTEGGLDYSFSGYNAGKEAIGNGYTTDGFSSCYKVGTTAILTSNLSFRVLQKGGQLTNSNGKINVTGANEIFLIISVGTDYSMASGLSNQYKTGETQEQLAQRVNNNVDAAYNALNTNGWHAIYDDHVSVTSAAMNASTFNLEGVTNDITSDVLHGKYNDAVGTTSVTASKYTRLIDMIMYQMGRYLSYSASENEHNIASANSGLPFYLQGIWANNSAQWRGDYHTNINFEMNYWPTEVTNLSSNIENLTTYVTTMASTRWNQYAQKKKADARGWVGDLGANNFGDLYHYWGGNEYVEANAWICESLWQHYLYTMDNSYLERIFPTLIEAAKFYLDYAKKDDGSTQKYIPQYYSPEINSGSGPAAHASQLVASLIDNVIAGYKMLGEPSSYATDIADLITLRGEMWDGIEIDDNGALEEWKGSELKANDHRHLSHLVCLYPLAQVSPMDASEIGQTRWNAAYKALTMRSDDKSEHALWNRAWKMNCYARALQGDLALRNYAYTFNEAVIGDFRSMCANRAFQIDGNCGVSAGIAEMLVQSYNSDITAEEPYAFITVAPALPSAWPAGNASGLKAIGNYTVDLTWNGGQVTEFTITYNGNSNLPFYVQCPGLSNTAYHVKSISNMNKGTETQTSVFSNSQIWYFTPSAKGASVTIEIGAGEDAQDNDGWQVNFGSSTTAAEWQAKYTNQTKYTSTAKFAVTDTYTWANDGVTIGDDAITVTCHPGYKFASVAVTSNGTVSVDGANVSGTKAFTPAATSFTLNSTAKITDVLFKLVVDPNYYTAEGTTQGTFPEALEGDVEDLAENFLMQDSDDNWFANSIKLYDNIDYKLDKKVTTNAFTYQRELAGNAVANGYWQPLYLPVAVADWSDFASKVIEFSGAKTEGDEEVLLYKPVTGALEAHTLYIFMPKANINLSYSDFTVNAKPTENASITHESDKFSYTLTGNYATKTDMESTFAYAL